MWTLMGHHLACLGTFVGFLSLWGPPATNDRLKVLFYSDVGIKMNVTQAGFIIMYSFFFF